MRRDISNVSAWRVGSGSISHSGTGVVLLPLSVVNRLN
jgi:hypothetical protein